jgi:hypothetical protein
VAAANVDGEAARSFALIQQLLALRYGPLRRDRTFFNRALKPDFCERHRGREAAADVEGTLA